jgi:cysteinyl-tRNA synthetase
MWLYNTLSRKKEEFKPIEEPYVKIVVCGPTLDNYMHLGHARLFIILDLLIRYLIYKGYKPLIRVVLTDIDPKIFRIRSMNYKDIISKYLIEFKRDLALLNISNLTFALASDYVSYAHDIILKLLDTGYAYLNKGNVYFNTYSINDYGVLAGFNTEDLKIRPIDLIADKCNPSDFMIWNGRERFDYSIKSDTLGIGLPWWNMQDLSIAVREFGSYDIQIGANELIYPHHEAIRAMLKALNLNVKYWFHIGLLTINNVKMGKSNANIIRVRDALEKYGLNAIRLYMLAKSYRTDLEFDHSVLANYHKKIFNIKGNSIPTSLEDDLNTEWIINNIEYVNKEFAENILGLRV